MHPLSYIDLIMIYTLFLYILHRAYDIYTAVSHGVKGSLQRCTADCFQDLASNAFSCSPSVHSCDSLYTYIYIQSRVEASDSALLRGNSPALIRCIYSVPLGREICNCRCCCCCPSKLLHREERLKMRAARIIP